MRNDFPTVEQILELMRVAKCGWHASLKKNHPLFVKYLKTLTGDTLREQIYNYCYPGSYSCKHCGSLNVSFKEFTTGYREYCSRNCTSKSNACKTGQSIFYKDKSRIAKKQQKTAATCIKKYGGPSPMSDSKINATVTEKRIITMRKKFPMTLHGRNRKEYTAAARYLTNIIYIQHRNQVDPKNLRSFDFVLDHVYSIFDGFINNVPLDIITHQSNLQIINRKSNSSKGARSDKTLKRLYEDVHLSL